MYIIQDVRTGKYVAYPGSAASFTPKLQNARQFPTREEAKGNACDEGERILSIEEAMRRRG